MVWNDDRHNCLRRKLLHQYIKFNSQAFQLSMPLLADIHRFARQTPRHRGLRLDILLLLSHHLDEERRPGASEWEVLYCGLTALDAKGDDRT
jgi:hypothetical protein